MTQAHTGKNLADALAACLKDYGLDGRVSQLPILECVFHANSNTRPQILAVVADNASNNKTMVEELTEQLNGFLGAASRGRCFAHVLNITVKVNA